MEKDFDEWNKKKKVIEVLLGVPGFHERELWYCRMGLNIGFEQDGKGKDFLRPIIIIRKFNNQIFWAIPLTSAHKKISKKASAYYFTFSFREGETSVAILSQIRLIDARRLSHSIGTISGNDFVLLKEKLKALIP